MKNQSAKMHEKKLKSGFKGYPPAATIGKASTADPYILKVYEHWEAIASLYFLYEDRRPIIELDIVKARISAHPAMDYLKGLSDRTRAKTRGQYKKAAAERALMVFVRDASKRALRSYIFPAK